MKEHAAIACIDALGDIFKQLIRLARLGPSLPATFENDRASLGNRCEGASVGTCFLEQRHQADGVEPRVAMIVCPIVRHARACFSIDSRTVCGGVNASAEQSYALPMR